VVVIVSEQYFLFVKICVEALFLVKKNGRQSVGWFLKNHAPYVIKSNKPLDF